MREDLTTTPNRLGVLVINETGNRKDGHMARQYLGNVARSTMEWFP
ncbi:MAG TPA: hypothetical protein VGN34_21550 [Ktedonobacteraceae bacterium]